LAFIPEDGEERSCPKKERGYTDIDVFRSSCLLYASVHDIVADCDKGKVKAKGPYT